MKINRAFIKGTNWALAGLLGLLGFADCNKVEPSDEYGVPYADYTVKGTVVDKATGKPIKGIRVGYYPSFASLLMYGTIPTPYQTKAAVTTDAKGAFVLTDPFYSGEINMDDPILPVYVEDIDGELNGLYQMDHLQVDFNKAVQTKKPKGWYDGEFTVTENVQLNGVSDK